MLRFSAVRTATIASQVTFFRIFERKYWSSHRKVWMKREKTICLGVGGAGSEKNFSRSTRSRDICTAQIPKTQQKRHNVCDYEQTFFRGEDKEVSKKTWKDTNSENGLTPPKARHQSVASNTCTSISILWVLSVWSTLWWSTGKCASSLCVGSPGWMAIASRTGEAGRSRLLKLFHFFIWSGPEVWLFMISL